ncbi:ATP-binding protein [Methylomagnum ishizawai]|uniref:ATP-binding protein n=1 Tax=Methylomagnum ishizawai TaxID=1760988 RepID=UPI001C32EAB1|nr:ATP-binding protein [Methylomagnum ishizawai]BBL75538.1 sigma factor serine-protein kinase [Methylomagnum ishizawai]
MPNTPNGSAAPAQLKLNLRPDTAELEPLSLAVEAFGADRDWSPALVMQINLVLEEIIVNTIDYGYPDGRAGRIEVVLEADASAIHIQIEDDADAFDPFAEAPRPDIAAVLADRPIGGLGVHLVRHYMDVCAYRRVPGRNLISLVKRLPSPAPAA